MQQLIIHPLLTDIVDHACLTENEGIQIYTVLPDIYTVIGFQVSGGIFHVEEDRSLNALGVTGILDRWRPFRSDAGTRSLLIFLKPGGFFRIFGPSAGGLKSDSLALADVTPSSVSRAFDDIFLAGGPFSDKWIRLQERFLKLIDRDLSPESRGALYHIYAENGSRRVASIASELGVSKRTLERKFAAEIGTSPKHLSRIYRWNNTMRDLGKYSDSGTAALANGYFDQAHFVRETIDLSGTSPGKLQLFGF